MSVMSRRAYRYTKAWLLGPIDSEEEEIVLDRGGSSVPATIVRPSGASAPLPGWVVLHGITRPGRAHPQLVRFTRALVSSGATVIVPEVPEWRELDLEPRVAVPTVAAAIAGLRSSGWARDEPLGVVGFSFGAPHAIACTADASIAPEVGGSVGFGGYLDIRTTFRFMMTGRYSYGGQEERIFPDPYGRWIVASNYLALSEVGAGREEAGAALRELAIYAGEAGVPSSDSFYDPLIDELAAKLPHDARRLFDAFTPRSGALPDEGVALDLAERLAETALRVHPTLDPRQSLTEVSHPTHVLHGRYDDLIPCSEAPLLTAALPQSTPSRLTITRLFGHSAQNPSPPLFRMLHEVPRFTHALTRVLALA